MQKSPHSLLIKLATISLVLVYLVIMAGAVVRATGSGMGCPDWPKCFGKLAPPTDSLSLPPDYRQLYVEKRKAKNARMAKVLRFFGANELADKIVNDPAINKELDFNVAKAWIEYANRLCGVLLGFGLLAVVIAAWMTRKTNRTVFYFSLLALLLTIFEGWLGSIVVSTNLLPGTITIHMFLALGIMALMSGITVQLKGIEAGTVLSSQKNLLRLVIFLSMVQIFLGTAVREQVDNISSRIDDRALWIQQLDQWFDVHRLLAGSVLIVNVLLFYRLRKAGEEAKRFVNYIMGVILLEIIAGTVMSFMALPAWVQPLHLFLAVLMFGLQVSLLQRAKKGAATSSAI